MRRLSSPSVIAKSIVYSKPLLVVDSLLAVFFLLVPNALIGSGFLYSQKLHNTGSSVSYIKDLIFLTNSLNAEIIALWQFLTSVYALLYLHYVNTSSFPL